MAYKINSYTGKPDYYQESAFRGVLASDPSNPKQGWWYINSGDHKQYIYYGNTWQVLATLSPAVQENIIFDGENVTFDGEQVKGQI